MPKPPDENDKKRAGMTNGDRYADVVPIKPTIEPAGKPPVDPLPILYAPALAERLPRIRWLCERFGMAPGRPVLFSGYGGIGKTFAAQELALAIAAGLKKTLGSVPIEASGAVLHIDFEQTQWITRWRYQRLAIGLGIDLASLGERLGLVSLPTMYLTDPRAEAELTRVATGKTLVIIDNLRAACPGADENSSTIRLYLDILTRVGEKTGAVFVVIVHEGKDSAQNPKAASQRVRGSSAITDAAGAVLSFVKEGNFIKVEQTRSNLGAPSEPVLIEFVDTGEVDPETKKSVGLQIGWVPVEQLVESKVGASDEQKEREFDGLVESIYGCIQRNPGIGGAGPVAARLHKRLVDVTRVFNELKALGRIENRGGGRSHGRWFAL